MLSRDFLIERGRCCGLGCLMCPYVPKHKKDNNEIFIKTKKIIQGKTEGTYAVLPQTLWYYGTIFTHISDIYFCYHIRQKDNIDLKDLTLNLGRYID